MFTWTLAAVLWGQNKVPVSSEATTKRCSSEDQNTNQSKANQSDKNDLKGQITSEIYHVYHLLTWRGQGLWAVLQLPSCRGNEMFWCHFCSFKLKRQDSPGTLDWRLAGLEEWDWGSGRERGLRPSLRSYAALPLAPASLWPVGVPAPPPPSSCPPPPSAWRCSRSVPWYFLCCCQLPNRVKKINEWLKLSIQTQMVLNTHQPPQVWFSGTMSSASPRLQRFLHSVDQRDEDVRQTSPHTHKLTHTLLTLSMRSFWTPNFPPNPFE